MASMTVHYSSSVLGNNITLNVIIPTLASNEQITNSDSKEIISYETGLPVVYLLHGAFGDYSSWMRYSNIERYAQDRKCAVVMASAGNNLYQDMAHGLKWETFFTQELPEFITSIFPVSKERRNTFIAGFSMGGYGAWYLALSHPELYAKSASLSGAVDIAKTYHEMQAGKFGGPFDWDLIFDNPESLENSDRDLLALYKKDMENGQVPKLYQTCGTEDFLYQININTRDRLIKMGADLIYKEGPGGHNWDYWDFVIRDVLDWMLHE